MGREKISLDMNWLFHAGEASNAQEKSYDDSQWRPLNVPHDWSIEGGYHKDHPSGNRGGYTQTGVAWYRKALEIPEEALAKKVFIEFDGIYMNSNVWINGHHVGHRPNGYIGFEYELTPYLEKSQNVIAVRLDTSKAPSARWYTGSGIYRHVWLTIKNPVYMEHWGSYVTTPDVSEERATVNIQTKVKNSLDADQTVELTALLVNEAGERVGETKSVDTIRSSEGYTFTQSMTVTHPQLWSTEHPYLYNLKLLLTQNERILDEQTIPLGIRYFSYDAEHGFALNGQSMKLQGVCLHADAGPVGYAVPEQVWERRLKILKDMGCNAIRTAHHPMAPEFYDLCDQLGFMVVDEVFDGWDETKATYDYGLYFDEYWKQDLHDFLLRDRNHPSIIIWSIGNEVEGIRTEVTQQLVEYVHAVEPTRPVTCGLDDITEEREANRKLLDIAGYNDGRAACFIYEKDHQNDPKRVMLGTETPHTFQTRGFYRTQTWWRDKDKPRKEIENLTEEEIFFDGALQYNSSYDNSGVRLCARDCWELTMKLPYLIGEFRWTGIDYLGESFGWPARMANFGIIDLCGFPKDHYYFYQSQWTDEPMVHILPHWTHPGLEGVAIPVWVYSNCDSVELFLNGESLGEQSMEGKMNLSWDVPYQPGALKAIGKKKGVIQAEKTMKTAGDPARICLKTDVSDLQPDSMDISHVSFEIVDQHGQLVPWAHDEVHFHTAGPVQLLGLENGDPLDLTPHQELYRKAFYGMGLGIFRSTVEEGEIRITAAGILGSRSFEHSTQVSIDVNEISLRGETVPPDYHIYYTIDGSPANQHSVLYEEPFRIDRDCIVKAAVYDGDEKIMCFESEFKKGAQEKIIDLTHGNRL